MSSGRLECLRTLVSSLEHGIKVKLTGVYLRAIFRYLESCFMKEAEEQDINPLVIASLVSLSGALTGWPFKVMSRGVPPC